MEQRKLKLNKANGRVIELEDAPVKVATCAPQSPASEAWGWSKRLVACHNALAGMDPAGVAYLIAAAENMLTASADDNSQAWIDAADAIEAALRKLRATA